MLFGSRPAQDPSVFEAHVEYVYVDVFVSERGSPVLGLRAADFELTDDGLSQSVEMVASETIPLRPILAFDTSESVRGGRLDALKVAGETFLAGLREGDEVAFLTFSHEIWRRTPWTSNFAAVASELRSAQTTGSTAAFDALYAAFLTVGIRERGLIVLFSDGLDNVSWLRARALRQVAERSNAQLEVVTLPPERQDGDMEHLRVPRSIAEGTGGRLWEAESPERLRDSFIALLSALRFRYVLRYEPRLGKRTGSHRLQVRLRHARGAVRARSSYFVPDAR